MDTHTSRCHSHTTLPHHTLTLPHPSHTWHFLYIHLPHYLFYITCLFFYTLPSEYGDVTPYRCAPLHTGFISSLFVRYSICSSQRISHLYHMAAPAHCGAFSLSCFASSFPWPYHLSCIMVARIYDLLRTAHTHAHLHTHSLHAPPHPAFLVDLHLSVTKYLFILSILANISVPMNNVYKRFAFCMLRRATATHAIYTGMRVYGSTCYACCTRLFCVCPHHTHTTHTLHTSQ